MAKVERKQAEYEFDNWLTSVRRVDEELVQEDEDAKEAREKIIKLIMRGEIVIDGNYILFNPRFPENEAGEEIPDLKQLKFPPRVLFGSLSNADKIKDGGDIKKTMANIGAITGISSGIIGKMDSSDVGRCGSLLQFYFL